MNKLFKKLHLWVSVPFGIVITITCFTGALLVFESDIVALCNRELTAVEPVGEPISIDELVDKVEATLPDGVEVTGVVVSHDPAEAYKVNISKPSRTAVYVDQYTGEVKGKAGRLPFFNTVRRLHRWLMDSRPNDGGIFWGKMIVGASTLAFVAILITGLVIWWPRNRKMLKNRLQIAIKKGKNRFWYDLHVAGGFYALLFLLAMALTGLTWSFEWYRNGFYSIFGEQVAQSDVKPSREKNVTAQKAEQVIPVDSMRTETFGEAVVLADAVSSATVQATTGATIQASDEQQCRPWQQALENVLAKTPSFETITVSDGVVTVSPAGFGNKRAVDKYRFNESTGEITSAELYSNTTLRSKATGWVRTIHVGSWGGLFSKTLYFLAALLGATLPLTGYYLWIKRLYGKRKKK